MLKRPHGRLTYANVTATLALFVALATGGAYAASQIGPKDIATNAVRAKHIKKGQVRAKHVQAGAVTEEKLADGVAVSGPQGPAGATGAQGPEGPEGPQGPADGPAGGVLTGSYPAPGLAAGAVHAPEFAGTFLRADTKQLTPGAQGTAFATCNPGEQLLSGGFGWGGWSDPNDLHIFWSQALSVPAGWQVRGKNNDGVSRTLEAWVVCLQA